MRIPALSFVIVYLFSNISSELQVVVSQPMWVPRLELMHVPLRLGYLTQCDILKIHTFAYKIRGAGVFHS